MKMKPKKFNGVKKKTLQKTGTCDDAYIIKWRQIANKVTERVVQLPMHGHGL